MGGGESGGIQYIIANETLSKKNKTEDGIIETELFKVKHRYKKKDRGKKNLNSLSDLRHNIKWLDTWVIGGEKKGEAVGESRRGTEKYLKSNKQKFSKSDEKYKPTNYVALIYSKQNTNKALPKHIKFQKSDTMTTHVILN